MQMQMLISTTSNLQSRVKEHRPKGKGKRSRSRFNEEGNLIRELFVDQEEEEERTYIANNIHNSH